MRYKDQLMKTEAIVKFTWCLSLTSPLLKLIAAGCSLSRHHASFVWHQYLQDHSRFSNPGGNDILKLHAALVSQLTLRPFRSTLWIFPSINFQLGRGPVLDLRLRSVLNMIECEHSPDRSIRLAFRFGSVFCRLSSLASCHLPSLPIFAGLVVQQPTHPTIYQIILVTMNGDFLREKGLGPINPGIST